MAPPRADHPVLSGESRHSYKPQREKAQGREFVPDATVAALRERTNWGDMLNLAPPYVESATEEFSQ